MTVCLQLHLFLKLFIYFSSPGSHFLKRFRRCSFFPFTAVRSPLPHYTLQRSPSIFLSFPVSIKSQPCLNQIITSSIYPTTYTSSLINQYTCTAFYNLAC